MTLDRAALTCALAFAALAGVALLRTFADNPAQETP